MSLYCYTDVPPAPAPIAPTPAPQPAAACSEFTEAGCYIDARRARIMEQVETSSTMSAEVRPPSLWSETEPLNIVKCFCFSFRFLISDMMPTLSLVAS